MAGTNDFVTFASASGANVITQATYLNLAAKATGFQSGIAASAQLNKVWRQSSIMSAMIGQFIADYANQNAVDDGTTATLEANFLAAIQAVNQTKVVGTLNLYVNPSTGNDANNGLSLTTAFRTIQRAFNVGYGEYNFQRNNLVVNLAAGTYTAGIVLWGMPVGCSTVQLLGNASSPGSYQINVTNANAIVANGGCNLIVTGVTITATGANTSIQGAGYGIIAAQGQVTAQNCVFGSCGTSQVTSTQSGVLVLVTCTFTGTSLYGIVAQASSMVWLNSTTLTWSSAVYTGANVYALDMGYIVAVAMTPAGSATGQRYSGVYNSIINTNGGGASLFPGTVAGTVTTGSYYT